MNLHSALRYDAREARVRYVATSSSPGPRVALTVARVPDPPSRHRRRRAKETICRREMNRRSRQEVRVCCYDMKHQSCGPEEGKQNSNIVVKRLLCSHALQTQHWQRETVLTVCIIIGLPTTLD
jgi:hypothetical protein